MSHADGKTSEDLARERTDFAVHRTVFAADRSLMAWVRTGLAIIGFGYTIYKIIESFGGETGPETAYKAGLFLISWGTLTIVFGCVEYWQAIRDIRSRHELPIRWFPVVFAGGFVLLGIGLLVSVALHLT